MAILSREFPLLGSLNYDAMRDRARFLKKQPPEAFRALPGQSGRAGMGCNDKNRLSAVIHGFIVADEAARNFTIEVENATDRAVVIEGSFHPGAGRAGI